MSKTIIRLTDEVQIIGRAGEQGDLAVAVDVTNWENSWPDGVGGILVTRPDGMRIPLLSEQDGNDLIGDIQPEAMTRPGVLKFEANWTLNGTVKASAEYTGLVMTSAIGRGMPPVGPFTPDWAKDVYAKAEQVLSACDAALQMTEMAEAAEASAEAADQSASDAKDDADRAAEIKDACEEIAESIPQDYSALSGDVEYFNAHNVLFENGEFNDKTLNAVTFTWDASRTVCTINAPTGPSGSPGNRFLYNDSSLAAAGLKAGETYLFDVTTTNSKCMVDLFWYTNGTLGSQIFISEPTLVTVPATATGVLSRVYVRSDAGVLTNEKVRVGILTAVNAGYVNAELKKRIWPKSASPYVSSSTITLGSIVEDGRYIIDASWTVTDAPDGYFPHGYVLTVENYSPTSAVHNFAKQTVEGIIGGNKLMFTRMKVAGSWTSWLNVRPMLRATIMPTGDSTDRKTDIEAALTRDGTAILAPGDYYVSGIEMPDNTDLRGSGMGNTRIILIEEDTGICVKMGTQCSVADLTLYGQEDTIPAANGERHGLGWVGTFLSELSPGTYPKHGMAHDIYIEGFAGGAVYCTGTSMMVNTGIQITNVSVYHCWAGIYVKTYSEFSAFTNVRACGCTYGCYNNGGNNVFTNCNFSMNTTALVMDDTGSQAPNNSHGSFVGCVFNHSGGNYGYAMILTGLDSGEVFSGCQVFYGKIKVTDCVGIKFADCNFGRRTDLEITGSDSVVFDSCQFREATDTPVTQSDNTGLRFDGCTLYDGSVFDPTGETQREHEFIRTRTQTPEIVQEESGSIASFADGADGVPMKAVLVKIEPLQEGEGDPSPDNVRPITGRTGLKITRCGKNLLPTRTTAASNHGVYYTPIVEDGLVTGVRTHGTQDGSASVLNLMPDGQGISLPAGTYRLSGGSEGAYLLLRRDRSGGTTVAENKTSAYTDFSLEGYTLLFNNGRKSGYSGEITERILYPMVRMADDTDDTFAPYQGDTYAIDWTDEAGTIYGGTLDVLTGVLTVDRAQIASYAGETLPGAWISDRDVYAEGTTPSTGAQVVYELATPQTYQITPLDVASQLGVNNVFADSGDVSIKYVADTKLYIDNEIAALQALVLEND